MVAGRPYTKGYKITTYYKDLVCCQMEKKLIYSPQVVCEFAASQEFEIIGR